MRKKVLTCVVMALFFLFWMFIAYQVPYTHDDWDWGLDIGLEQWRTGSVNSRLVGNFFVIVMTRSPLLKTLIMGLCMFACPLLLARLAQDKVPLLPLYLGANLLPLALPITIWRQTYGWVSGFANYGISSVLLLGWLLLIRRAFNSPKHPVCLALFLLPYSLAAPLLERNILQVLCLLALCAQLSWYIPVYHQVGHSTALRAELTAAAVAEGADQVILPTESHPVWWGRNPQSALRTLITAAQTPLPKSKGRLFENSLPFPMYGRARISVSVGNFRKLFLIFRCRPPIVL